MTAHIEKDTLDGGNPTYGHKTAYAAFVRGFDKNLSITEPKVAFA
jgi:hypothetical protein